MRHFCVKRIKAREIKGYLFIHGINKIYAWWLWNGTSELSNMSTNYQDKGGYQKGEINVDLDDHLEDMVHDIVEDNFVEWPYILNSLFSDVKKPFYPAYIKFTQLSTMLRLFNLKEGKDGVTKVSWPCLKG